jgi:hypothetical protein
MGYDPGPDGDGDFVVPNARDFVWAERHAPDVLTCSVRRFELHLGNVIPTKFGREFASDKRAIRGDDLDRHAGEVASSRTRRLDLQSDDGARRDLRRRRLDHLDRRRVSAIVASQ